MNDLHNKLLVLLLLFISFKSWATCQSDWQKVQRSKSVPLKYRDTINNCDKDLKSKLFHKVKTNIYLDYRDAREYFFKR